MDAIQTILSLLLAGAAGLAFYRLVFDFTLSSGRLPPKGRGIPFIGDTFGIITKGPAEVGRTHVARLGNIYRTWFLGAQVIHIGELDCAKQVFNAEHDLVEEDWPYTVRELLGPKSASTMYGQHHVQMRKTFAPSFTPKAMAAKTARLVKGAQQVCAEMADAATPKGEDAMKRFAFKMNTELVLGFDPSHLTDEHVVRQQKLWDVWTQGLFSLPINLPGFAFHRAMQARKDILAEYRDNIVRLIEEPSKFYEADAKSPMQRYVQTILSSDDFDKDVFDMEHFVNVAFNLLFAGHGTAAAAMTMLLRHLRLCPQVLEKLREEQSQVIAEHGEEIDATALAAMPYADATVKEGLRKSIIVPAVNRVALKTFQLGQYTVPKGYKISLELWKIIEDDLRWRDAEPELAPSKFNPDRWMNDEGRRAGAWLPFASGQRMCLGFQFALQEIKIMLAVLARGYDWEIDPDEPLSTFPGILPANGLPLKFTKLQRPLIVREE